MLFKVAVLPPTAIAGSVVTAPAGFGMDSSLVRHGGERQHGWQQRQRLRQEPHSPGELKE
ncbi:hypothetical protein K438DRAFT_1994679 [Mycena galopus ATCC 62051]|nr:hypothetical protein K438DRAFT_1994679 [Mycena galopus ATCC 62051]